MARSRLTGALKAWLPPALLQWRRRHLTSGIRYEGSYASWQEALRHSTGYDSPVILERVAAALQKVRSGEAAGERDSVLLERAALPFPLLAGLLHAAATHGGRLTVLDVGGSLGSTYFQCRDFLAGLRELVWCVVEQEHFVRRGRESFESDQLRFYPSLEECVRDRTPAVVLFSSVLQYLPDPHAALQAARECGADLIIIDRTPFSGLAQDRLCVQHVPERIYPASYPCWIFGMESLARCLVGRFEPAAEFAAEDGPGLAGGVAFSFKGVMWRRRRDD